MPSYRINAPSSLIWRRARQAFKTAGNWRCDELEGQTFLARVNKKHSNFIAHMVRRFGITARRIDEREAATIQERQTQVTLHSSLPGLVEGQIRYIVWALPGTRKRLRRCRKHLTKTNFTCVDAPVEDSFYVFASDEKIKYLAKQVGVYRLGGYVAVPEGTNPATLITEVKKGEKPMVEENLSVAYEEATAILRKAQAEAAVQSKQEEVVDETPEGETPKVSAPATPQDAVVTASPSPEPSFQLRDGRVITLETIQDLATRYNLQESIRELHIASKTFYAMLRAIPGALAVPFSYFCRTQGCSQFGQLIGRGKEGESLHKNHVGRVHRGGRKALNLHQRQAHKQLRLAKRAGEDTMTMASISMLSDEELVKLVQYRIELRESEVTLLKQKQKEIEAELQQAQARLDALRALSLS